VKRNNGMARRICDFDRGANRCGDRDFYFIAIYQSTHFNFLHTPDLKLRANNIGSSRTIAFDILSPIPVHHDKGALVRVRNINSPGL
jgi:hypothetical protein